MSFVVDQFKLLGLSHKETRVFIALATFGKMNMMTVAERASLPRTTVDAIVRRLVVQGIVNREKVGGHYEYSVDLTEVADKLHWLERRLRPNQCRVDEKLDRTHEKEINDEHNVKKELNLGYFNDVFERHKGDRVRIMLSRGHNGMNECVERLGQYTKLAIDHALMLEVLLCSQIADMVRDGKGTVPLPPRSDMVRFNIVPGSYCVATTDLIVLRNQVLVVEPDRGVIEEIRSDAAVESIKHLLDVACETGWSVDLTAWVGQ
jgi:predicted transcriptional regulator